jgi:hypothetical protein
MSKLLSLRIADRLQPIVLSFSKGAGTMRGASIDLRELAGSTGNDFTDDRAARRWNSQTSRCEYSRWKEARNTLDHSTGDQTPEASQAAYSYAQYDLLVSRGWRMFESLSRPAAIEQRGAICRRYVNVRNTT